MDGYFPPESAIRRIGGESVLMLGGGRALLMQAAHPLVAAGVAGHSAYRAEPWRRLARTMTALYTLVFGTREEADRAAAAVHAVHARVRGTAPAGRPYSATDPDLMLWVHTTLVDTGLVMYETYVGGLDEADREAFYRDMAVVARLFGVPEGVLPRTLREWEDYRQAMLAGPELEVTPIARDIAGVVFRPPLPLAVQPLFRAMRLPTIGLLPPELRERYGFRWGRAERTAYRGAVLSARAVVPLLPPVQGMPLRVLARVAA